MLKRSVGLVVGFSVFFAACSTSSDQVCQSEPPLDIPRPQELRTSLMSDPPSLNPRIGVDTISHGITGMLFTGLTFIDQDGTAKLSLADSYTVSVDFKTYTFFLKKSCWSDGTPLTAHDFEETWKKTLTPGVRASAVNLLYVIKNGRPAKLGEASIDTVGIRALNDRTLVIELENPNSAFLDVLTNCAFYPLPKTLREGELDFESYVGCGPFKLTQYDLQNQIVIEKNPHYWDASRIRLEKIHYLIIKDETTALRMFEKGELDWLGTPLSAISNDAVPELKKKGLLKIAHLAGTTWLEFNVNKYPFQNINIRKALAYAIDRKGIIENIMQTENEPSLGVIPKIQKKERWHPYFQDNDQKKAKECFAKGLKELDITLDQFPEITLSYNNADVWRKSMLVVQQEWSEVFGINVKVEGVDWGTHFNKLLKREFEVARFGWIVQYNDPANFLDVFKFKDFLNNHTGWENKNFAHCLDEANIAVAEKRWEFLEAAEQILLDEMPVIPFCHMTSITLQKPYLKNICLTSLMADFRWAYIDESKE